MRGLMSTVVSGVMIAMTVAVGTAGASPAPTGATARQVAELPEEVEGGVVVALPEGDRFKVWHSRDLRTVWGQRYDAAAASWSDRTVVLRERDLECGDVDARASAGAVAVIAECDRGGYSEDQAPVASHALWSADTVTWTAHELDGEAYEEPGISPDGQAAVWPMHEAYVTWTRAEGFVHRRVEAEGQEYTVTATIADDGSVSFLYAGDDGDGAGCGLHVVTQPSTGAPWRQSIPVPDACGDEHDLVNVDALTVHLGFYLSPAYRTILTRPDTSAPWSVTSPAPAGAPGLVRHGGRAHTTFFSPPGLPLVALGSPDRRVFQAQTYDEVHQRWNPPREVARLDRRCRWDSSRSSPRLPVLVAGLRCDGPERALISTDGTTWSDVALHRPLGFSPDEQSVSTSRRGSTTVFSRTLGRVRIPLGAPRPCDVVLPASPTSLLRLTTSDESGWPTTLQRSTTSGWRRTDTRVPRVRAGAAPCSRVRSFVYGDEPATYWLTGRGTGLALAITRHRDGWAVRRVY